MGRLWNTWIIAGEIFYLRSDGIKTLFSRHRALLGLKLATLLALSALLMLFDSHYHSVDKVRVTLSRLISPLQYLVDWPTRAYQDLQTTLSSQKELMAENTRLRYQQLSLLSELQRLTALKNENKQLRKLLSQGSLKKNNRLLLAELLGLRTSVYRHLIILNKGSKDSVFVGQAVLDAKGVMGQVVEVGPVTSTVMLITDVKSSVPVKNARTGERAILVGSPERGTLSLINLPATSQIKTGDKLVTSGLGQLYPEGYPIGIVTQVGRNKNQPFINIEVAPEAEVNRSRLLILLIPSKKQKLLQEELKSRYLQNQGRS